MKIINAEKAEQIIEKAEIRWEKRRAKAEKKYKATLLKTIAAEIRTNSRSGRHSVSVEINTDLVNVMEIRMLLEEKGYSTQMHYPGYPPKLFIDLRKREV